MQTIPDRKTTKNGAKTSTTRCSDALNFIQTDLCGSMETCSVGGAKYFILFKDDYSRYVSVRFLKTKNEAVSEFQKWIRLTEIQLTHIIKSIRSDREGEFLSKEFAETLYQSRIKHQTRISYTPQRNGVAERMMRTVMEMAVCASARWPGQQFLG